MTALPAGACRFRRIACSKPPAGAWNQTCTARGTCWQARCRIGNSVPRAELFPGGEQQAQSICAQISRKFDGGEIIQEHDRRQGHVDQPAAKRTGKGDGQQNGGNLRYCDPRPAGGARRSSGRKSDRVGDKQHLAKWVVGEHQADEAHASEACPVGQGTDCVPSFPAAQRGSIADDGRLTLVVLDREERARGSDGMRSQQSEISTKRCRFAKPRFRRPAPPVIAPIASDLSAE